MKLMTESNFDVNIDTDSKKNLYVEGVFAGCEQMNENGRIYPRHILEREITRIDESVKGRSCIGELDHPTNRAEPLLSEASHLIQELKWQGNEVYGRAKVLTSTPRGLTLKGLVDDGVKIGISTRGLGETTFDKSRDAEMVNESYQLLTWDIVLNPSHQTAFVNGIYEGKDFGLPTIPTQVVPDKIDVLKEHERRIWQVISNIK